MPWCPQHLPRPRRVASTDQPHIRSRVVRGAKGARADEGHADVTEANDPVRVASWMIQRAATAAAPHRRSRRALKCGRRGAS
jgi:hypothetical protein